MSRQCPKSMAYILASINSIGNNMDNVVSRMNGIKAFPDTFHVDYKKNDTGMTLDQIRINNSAAFPFKQLLTDQNILATF